MNDRPDARRALERTSSAHIGRRGMVLGKFLPPHRGHLHLIETAACAVEELVVVVGSLEREPIPGDLRVTWLKELVPHVTVMHLCKELPQTPEEHPDFWRLWRDSLRALLVDDVEVVFASESYGGRLAAELSARYIPVDPGRVLHDVSGTRVRANPLLHANLLPANVQEFFSFQICIAGPESVGKTTLAQSLAQTFGGLFVPEYARTYLEAKGAAPVFEDMHIIAAMQQATTQRAWMRADHGIRDMVRFFDTDALATVVWSEFLFGRVDARVQDAALSLGRAPDLTLVLRPDVPWVADPIRYAEGQGDSFFARTIELLELAKRPYAIIEGRDWSGRERVASQAVRALLDTPWQQRGLVPRERARRSV